MPVADEDSRALDRRAELSAGLTTHLDRLLLGVEVGSTVTLQVGSSFRLIGIPVSGKS